MDGLARDLDGSGGCRKEEEEAAGTEGTGDSGFDRKGSGGVADSTSGPSGTLGSGKDLRPSTRMGEMASEVLVVLTPQSSKSGRLPSSSSTPAQSMWLGVNGVIGPLGVSAPARTCSTSALISSVIDVEVVVGGGTVICGMFLAVDRLRAPGLAEPAGFVGVVFGVVSDVLDVLLVDVELAVSDDLDVVLTVVAVDELAVTAPVPPLPLPPLPLELAPPLPAPLPLPCPLVGPPRFPLPIPLNGEPASSVRPQSRVGGGDFAVAVSITSRSGEE